MSVVKSVSRKLLIRAIAEYSQRVQGYREKPGVTVFVLGCRALSLRDRPRPDGFSHEAWCWENAAHIVSVSKIKPRKKDRRKSIGPKAQFDGKQVSTTAKNFIADDGFLATYEWRRLRMEALKKYGPKCMCCGATPATGAVMHVDHIKPRKLFPELALALDNLQILCHECNHGKGNWDQSDWRPATFP
jgi:5-methylcytosine-specific restriction endonuclease McrA